MISCPNSRWRAWTTGLLDYWTTGTLGSSGKNGKVPGLLSVQETFMALYHVSFLVSACTKGYLVRYYDNLFKSCISLLLITLMRGV